MSNTHSKSGRLLELERRKLNLLEGLQATLRDLSVINIHSHPDPDYVQALKVMAQGYRTSIREIETILDHEYNGKAPGHRAP